ncbi:hypothetical protein P9112_007681 [Eukaryota sp. TZLM1-RC]
MNPSRKSFIGLRTNSVTNVPAVIQSQRRLSVPANFIFDDAARELLSQDPYSAHEEESLVDEITSLQDLRRSSVSLSEAPRSATATPIGPPSPLPPPCVNHVEFGLDIGVASPSLPTKQSLSGEFQDTQTVSNHPSLPQAIQMLHHEEKLLEQQFNQDQYFGDVFFSNDLEPTGHQKEMTKHRDAKMVPCHDGYPLTRYLGTIVWCHSKLGIALIVPNPQSLQLLHLNFKAKCSLLPDVVVVIELAKEGPPNLSLHCMVSFQIDSSATTLLSACDVTIARPVSSLQTIHCPNRIYTGHIYSWRAMFGFVKSSTGLEVYITREQRKKQPLFEEGQLVTFEAVWEGDKPQGRNVEVLTQYSNTEVKAVIIAIVPLAGKGVPMGVAVSYGPNCVRNTLVEKSPVNAKGFNLSDDVIVFRLGSVRAANGSSISEGDWPMLLGQHCKMVISPHVSGFWHSKSCICIGGDLGSPSTSFSDATDLASLDTLSVSDIEPNTRLLGEVTRIVRKPDKEFGFLKTPNLNCEVYFHFGRLSSSTTMPSAGAMVKFTLIYSTTGQPQAKDVSVL